MNASASSPRSPRSDDRHAAGDLDDETWSAERLALMNNLRTVTAELERLDGGRRGASNRG